MKLEDLKIKIFADGADLETIKQLADNPLIAGFTTNPTLLRKAGVTDYAAFGKEVAKIVAPRPVSFEVFADDFEGMERQAQTIAEWGENVYVKIPITNTEGKSTKSVVRHLSNDYVKLNITAITTKAQISTITNYLNNDIPHYLSVFAGRIADADGRPHAVVRHALKHARYTKTEVIWASPREVANVYEANRVGCHIITVTTDILSKLPLRGKDLTEYSLETVRMFHNDAMQAGYAI